MNNKKTQLNQVFVYLLSFIVVAFVGFLVTKFILTFSGDVDSRVDMKFFNDLERDYKSVYQSYGSEKVLEYRLTSEVDQVCFISKKSCIGDLNLSSQKNESLNIALESGDNIVVFDSNDILNSKNIGSFNGLCDCLKPKNSRIKLVIENRQNKVYIAQLE